MADQNLNFQNPDELPSSRPVGGHIHPLSSWENIPIFQDEEAEAEFWALNRPSLSLMESSVMRAKGASSESVTISLRIDARMLARLKRLARSRFLNYQSMMKQWISERMESEIRTQSQDDE